MFIISIIYQPTFSGVFTNCDNFLPTSYKHGLVDALIF